jgi:hypothetical protein
MFYSKFTDPKFINVVFFIKKIINLKAKANELISLCINALLFFLLFFSKDLNYPLKISGITLTTFY